MDLTSSMVKLVEIWLGNPITRNALKACVADCKCGNRLELALKSYTGEKVELCVKCKAASFTVKKVIDKFVSSGNIPKDVVIEYLKTPLWRKGLANVLGGIALFGVRKPFVAASPFLAVWNMSRLCNLKCIHCYESADVRAPDELSTNQALDAVDEMADAGLAYLALSGGEPLMHPDFFKIVERINEREIAFSIATNATLITDEVAKKLKAANCLYAQVSIDGLAETHNKFRGVNSFERTCEGVKKLVKAGVLVGISCTITKHNLNEVPKVIDLAEELGAGIFMAYNFIPTGRGEEIVNLDISPKEREELLNYLFSQQGKRKLNILSTAPQYSRVCVEGGTLSMTHFDVFSTDADYLKKISFLAEFVGGCGAGRLYVCLEPNGDIRPCVFMPIKLGNILKDNFKEVWQKHPILKKMRDRQNFLGNCGKCDKQNICGGCRARAYAYFNDVSACDPGCIRNELAWEKLKSPISEQLRAK